MAPRDDISVGDITVRPQAQESRGLLRFMTCGAAGDGKSTLTARLRDDLAALSPGQPATPAAQRGPGAPVDATYGHFAAAGRQFIVADLPGDAPYTQTMAAEASTADLALVVVDARTGLLTQTRQHSYIVSLLGIRRVVLCVNKMDLVAFDQQAFNRIDEAYRSFAASLGIERLVTIPVSALAGDNVSRPSARMPWYDGPTLMHHLETVEVDGDDRSRSFRLPVQWVNRAGPDVCGCAGQIAGGVVRQGDRIKVLPSGRESRIVRIVTSDGVLDEAVTGQSVSLVLADDIDVSRGDVIASADDPCEVADQFEAHILWMSREHMLPGRQYLMKIGTGTAICSPAAPKYKVNIDTLERLAAKALELNEIGVCNISLDRTIPFDAYAKNRETGGFILIDRLTNETVGRGLLHFALRRASNIHRQAMRIGKAERAAQKGQKPAILWFTGLSGAGKSTIADMVAQKLHAMNRHTATLDGDNVRHGLTRDLGFTDVDRVENIRRVAEVSKLMIESGLIVLTSFISPFRAERRMARSLVEDGEFVEVFVHAPLEVAESRDVKGLYRKARRGEIKNFTGIDSPYEPPHAAEITIDTTQVSAEEAADLIVAWLAERCYLG